MSVGPMSAAGGFAGAPLAQAHGSEAERAVQQARAQERRAQSEAKAADAAGIAATDGEDNQPQERDADGRRLWERQQQPSDTDANAGADSDSDSSPANSHSPCDPRGESGMQLDLTG